MERRSEAPAGGIHEIELRTGTVIASGSAVGRIGAMVLRYFYVLRSSLPRLVELAYWPSVQVLIWGFITQFFATNSSYIVQAFGVLLSGVLLWDVLFRAQIGVSVSFLEEMWSRNIGHLFVAPLRPLEMAAAMLFMSLIRTLIAILPATLLAYFAFKYSIYSMGLPLVAFFANLLVMGWAVGLMICGLLLRYGLAAESLAWGVVFALSPLSGVFYPITILPGWLQPVARILPSAQVFEGMRAVLVHHRFRSDLFFNALLLNAGFLTLGVVVFLLAFRGARKRGQLLQIGE